MAAGQTATRNGTRSVLGVIQSAVAVLLLIGAVLVSRSVIQFQNSNPGVDALDVLAMQPALPRQKCPSHAKMGDFFTALQTRVAGLSGVQSVGLFSELPLTDQRNDMPFTVEGRTPLAPNQRLGADFRRINEHYF